ncbi:MAG: hypothetical protein IPI02_16155 [Sterolibacteriaceae bacterium]|nr:hypothetical protein [Sterolibacteriaceae bacterium]
MKFAKHLVALLTFCSLWPGVAFSGTLAEIPLNLRGNVPSNVLFDMSVEWPTAITAAYNGIPYVRTDQFEGLFDPNLCYDYSANHFVPVGIAAATTHACSSGQWSGNFLNWATMTGLDAFRYATTGGNRSTDTAALTILERTYISNQGNLFPSKTFNPTTAEFVGATPFSVNTTYTMVNAGMGIQMSLSGTETVTNTTTGTSEITCNPRNSSPYCNSITLSADNSSGTCTATTGNGTALNPYRCTTFGTFSGGATTITGINSCLGTGTNGNGKTVCNKYSANFSSTATNTNNVNNTYNVRVEACNKTYPLRENCQQYGNVFKPVGELQRNGEKMRFGVFAYYNNRPDPADPLNKILPDIDNAVMRSKLKYVAPRKYSGSLGFIANANTEWSQADGTFVTNPDPTEATSSWGGAVTNSGVVNYLNKFGRQSGRYKTYDNFGKMYYESLRYLRKLPPTQEFYQFSSPANNDDFPVITDWYRNNDDPIQYTCQKNYIIAMGDQFTHCDKRLPRGSFEAFGPSQCRASGGQAADQGSLDNGDPIDVTALTNALGNLEIPTLPALATTGTGAGVAASFYMAGLAHWAAINDIRPDLANNVPYIDPVTSQKTLKGQTVKTFVINVEENAALGVNSQFWYMAKYGGAEKYTQTGARAGEPLDWSKNVNYTSFKPDGTVNQSFNGQWPKTLLRAGNPASMIASIKEALASVEGEIGSNSGLSQSSGDLRTGDGAYIYRAIYDSDRWSGNVQAYEITSDGTIASTPVWEAASLLPTPTNRVIMSFNDGLLVSGNDETNPNARRGIRFDPAGFATAPSIVSERQRKFLDSDEFGTVDNQGENRMRYLRGDATNEAPTGLQWRARSWTANGATVTNRLGDIVNSNPIYVGPPASEMPGAGYNDFAKLVRDRRPVVYVGANDGMLHAFDASKPGTVGATPGEELFAYVPSAVYSRLSQLTSPGYSHKYFVDGSPVVSEACSGTCAGSSDWKTVLVGGLNAGGQGVYALNVTRPEQFSSLPPTDIVMWEFTDRDDADLGYTFSAPVIRLMNNGKWAVIFGNGFNNTINDGKIGTGRAYLYVLMLDGPGAGNKWVKDTNYFKIELKSPSEPLSATLPLGDPNKNGLASAAAVDRDLDGAADTIYAGDLQGNMWKIDVSDTDPTKWTPAFGSASSPLPLFASQYTDNNGTDITQPITTGVEVSPHPNRGYMVMFGTGSFINSSDNLGPFKIDSVYGIWDKEDVAKTRVTSRSQLQCQKIIDTTTQNGNEYLFMSACRPNFTDANAVSNETPGLCPADIANTVPQLGWLFDLPDSGERTASEAPFVQGGILTFTTLTPADDPCSGNIVGRLYYLNYLTGGAAPSGVFDLNSDARIDQSDKFDIGSLGYIAPSGVKTDGSMGNPVRFFKRHPAADGSGSGSGSGSNSSTHACADFVPGWGCLSTLAAQRNCGRWGTDVKSNNPLRDALSAGGAGLTATDICLFGNAGRLTWRQLVQ